LHSSITVFLVSGHRSMTRSAGMRKTMRARQ
jgi:hypothetical protein